MTLHMAAVFALLLATLAATSSGVPVQHSTWLHPCGRAERKEKDPNSAEIKGRHEVCRILEPVRNQTELANSYFRRHNQTIGEVYKQVKEFNTCKDCYKWLPKNQLQWYKGRKPVRKALKHFNATLQIFSATFEELKKHTPDENARNRKKIIGGIYEQLNQLLCEVDGANKILNVTVTTIRKEDFILKKEEFQKKHDDTNSLSLDWSLIKFCETYLREWNQIIERLSDKLQCKSSSRNKTERRKKKKNRRQKS